MDRHSDSWRHRQELTQQLRREVYEAYGGAFCACCGESEMVFLTLDHSWNDGAEERRGKRKGADLRYYSDLKAAGFPQDRGLRVLCWNCNCGRQRNEGICPHVERKKARAAKINLTDDDIQFIRSQRGHKGPRRPDEKRWTLQDLSIKYGISQATLHKIQQQEE